MELDENDLKNLRINETYILKQFISFCENNNLKYFMAFGSLLGTIRHQGFIPWDDDIDVMMPRKDYDKFIDCFMATKRNDLFLQTHITDSEFQYNYAKIRLNNTVFLEVGSNHSSIHNEIFIDI
ncbi:MAG: LicD family protein, partial [Bacilli bacterium]